MSEAVPPHPPAPRRHPAWLKVRAPFGPRVHELKKLLHGLQLNTVCQEALCPNMGECWSHGVATFMILGDVCTRGCRYCAVDKGRPATLDREEPWRVAEAVAAMQLSHVVLTSVDRDDQPDGGAGIFAETIRQIRRLRPGCVVEVLTPDFQGRRESVEEVLEARPEVFGHNVETVPRLYRRARGGGKYDITLNVLRMAREWDPAGVTKTGVMLGLGEGEDELMDLVREVRGCGVNILTLGQYLQPTRKHLPVERHYTPEEFVQWRDRALSVGFEHVEAGPLVRSSYLADRQFHSFRGDLVTLD